MGAAPQLGQVIDHYRLVEKLGEGGMGVVFLAEDTRLGRKVAIKFLSPEAMRSPERRQRFQQEARAAAALDHPGIATVYELEESAGELYIVFEYVRGCTLRTLVLPGGAPRDDLLDIGGDVAEALRAAHAVGIVHRDLKPENVMRTPEGGCKVLDFGLARFNPLGPDAAETSTQTHLTAAGMLVGTIGYMSPEQLEGKEADFRSDLFSFGAMIYELATGVHPFAAGSSASTIAAILTAEPLSLTARNQLQPPELERIVRKCLRKRREERYQSTADLVVDLRDLQRETETSRSSAIAPPPAEEEEENVLNTVLRRLLPNPRRWWELNALKVLLAQIPAIYLAWRIRQVALQDWAPVAFLAMVAICIAHATMRAIMVVTAAAAPRELPQRVRSLQPWLSLIAYAQAALWVPLALMLGFDRYPLGAPLIVALGVGFLIWGVIEPMLARQAFPHAFAAKPAEPSSGGRGWFWAHYLITLFVTTPIVVWLAWHARNSMPPSLRQPIFLFNAFALGLHWSARFSLVNAVIGNPADAPNQAVRLRPWIRWSGWLVVSGLAGTSLAIAFTDEVLAAIVAALAMGGVGCLVFLDPAVERAAFPSASATSAAGVQIEKPSKSS